MISVVITTFERPVKFKRAFNSVLKQMYKPSEIIVVEDGSDTGLYDWLCSHDMNVAYVKNDINMGLAYSRNIGMKMACNNWVAYLDDDDTWQPNRLYVQVELINNISPNKLNKLACIQVGNQTINKNGELIRQQFPKNNGNIKDSIIKHGVSTPSSCFLFNKTALTNVGGFSEDLSSGIDHDIMMKLAVADYHTIAINRPLVNIYEEGLPTMMMNTDNRIKGIHQYVEKWKPTYKEWFGAKEGLYYAKRYYSNVIGTLAANKFVTAQYKEFFIATKAIINYTGFSIPILYNLCRKFFSTVIMYRFPSVRLKLKKFKSQEPLNLT